MCRQQPVLAALTHLLEVELTFVCPPDHLRRQNVSRASIWSLMESTKKMFSRTEVKMGPFTFTGSHPSSLVFESGSKTLRKCCVFSTDYCNWNTVALVMNPARPPDSMWEVLSAPLGSHSVSTEEPGVSPSGVYNVWSKRDTNTSTICLWHVHLTAVFIVALLLDLFPFWVWAPSSHPFVQIFEKGLFIVAQPGINLSDQIVKFSSISQTGFRNIQLLLHWLPAIV